MSKWLRQALSDLEAARDSFKTDHCEWSCFQAQQAAEKAVKHFLYSRGYTSILSHSLTELVREATKLEPGFSVIERSDAWTRSTFRRATRTVWPET